LILIFARSFKINIEFPAPAIARKDIIMPVHAEGAGVSSLRSGQGHPFHASEITVPAGAAVTVFFDNQDAGVPHNVAVYTNQQAATKILSGQIINGPATTTYTFIALSTPGSYWFRCDVHPT
jgi:plastocyanin